MRRCVVGRLKQSEAMHDATDLTAPPPRAWLRPELVRSWTEFIVVAGLVMALPIRNSTVAALHGSSGRFMQLFMADTRLSWAIFIESVLLALFLYYLHRRGWRPADLRIGLGWATIGLGLALFVGCQVVTSGVVMGCSGSCSRCRTSSFISRTTCWPWARTSRATAST